MSDCLTAALKYLELRPHSRRELERKLARKKFTPDQITGVLEKLQNLKYLDDARFAVAKASSAARNKHHGKRRAFAELLKSGVQSEVAEKAVKAVYSEIDSLAVARDLAQRQFARLQRLEPMVARRRLIGMLQRRGFEYESIKRVVDEVLGNGGVTD